MSTIAPRPGHPLVHEAPPRNYEPLLLATIVGFGALIIGMVLLLMITL